MITGGKGMLGRTLTNQFKEYEVVIADLPEVSILQPSQFEQFVKVNKPDVIIHCAAMTNVDRCQSEFEQAALLNSYGTKIVAEICKKYNIRLIAISTDYVFDGKSDRPYTELDKANGGWTVYGQTKFQGEQFVREVNPPNYVICRISWLYGAGGPSFVHAMMKLADGTRDQLKVVNDQIGNPTSCLAVARELKEIIEREDITGTIHATCEGEATWYDFAKEIFRLTNNNQKVVPCSTEEFPRPAPRPKNSRLEKYNIKRLNLSPMPNWKDALAEFLQTEKFK